MSAEEQMKTAGASEEGKKMMDAWMAWMQKIGSALVDGGTPLGNDTHVIKNGSSMDHTGDYIGGYTIIQAESMDAAKTMFTDHPHFMQEGNTIEILEMLPMPGM